MLRIALPLFGIVAACMASTSHALDLESGLQAGDKAGVFIVKDITGPRKGKSLCYR